MNYQKIYDNIIDKSKFEYRIKDSLIYYENHHIIPKCIGGNNSKENLTLLTAKEHFICHKLLVEIYPDNKKLFYSYFMMSHDKRNGRNYRVSSREYNRLSQINSELAREKFKGEGNHFYGSNREGKLNPFYGKTHSEESIELAREKRREKYNREGSPLTGIPKSEEHKKHLRENHADFKGENHPMFGKTRSRESIEKSRESFKKNYKKENHPCFNKLKKEDVKEKIRNTLRNKYAKGQHPNTGVKKTEVARINNSIAQKNRRKLTCPHCNITMDICNVKKYHFDNCRTLIKIKQNEC